MTLALLFVGTLTAFSCIKLFVHKVGAAFVALALTLTAAGYGFAGWVWIGAPVCIVLFAIGLTVVLLEHKRVMAAEGKNLTDPSGH